MLIYGKNTSKRKKPSNKALRLREERKAMFAAILGTKKRDRPNHMPDLSCPSNAAPLSNDIPGYGFKRSVDDWRWKRDREESAETIAEIERKKTRVAPLWNKGSTMYITDEEDPTTIGKKI